MLAVRSAGAQLRVKLGIYRSPEEFTEAACSLEHPFAQHTADDAVNMAIASTVLDGAGQTKAK